jgi:hypothetical protein
MSQPFLRAGLLLLAVVVHSFAISQQLTIKTKKIDLLIEEWNIIHNARTLDGFKEVYAEDLVFYGTKTNQSKAVLLKEQLFLRQPEFRQRISSDITYTVYTNGVIKADFTKEVWDDKQWKPYESYLLVGYEKNRYRIVAESDYQTDKKVGYKPKLGKAVEMEILSEKIKSPTEEKADLYSSKVATSLAKNAAATITVPKDYVYILIGLLGGGGLLIFIGDSILAYRRRRVDVVKSAKPAPKVSQPVVEKPVYAAAVPVGSMEEPEVYTDNPSPVDESIIIIENQLKQSAFRAFVMSLFDPMNFTYRQPRVMTGNDRIDNEPNLEFEVNGMDPPVRFAVQCLYREDTPGIDIDLFPEEKLRFNNQFQDINLYYVLGVGGPPERPNNLYLVQAKSIKATTVLKEQLVPFRRVGKFYYNPDEQKLH